MNFLKRALSDSLKEAAFLAKKKLEAGADSVKSAASDIGERAVALSSSSVEAIRDFDYSGAKQKLVDSASVLTNDAEAVARQAVDTVRNFDLEQSKESVVNFVTHSTEKLHQYFCTTMEVDRSTFDIVNEIRKKLPTPANSIDEIYEQCRNDAVRRAITAFMLGNLLDKQSEAKYDKLSDDYQDYRVSHKEFMGDHHPNFWELKPDATVQNGDRFANGYNPDDPLVHMKTRGNVVSIDHVTSRKELFSSTLLKAGLTDEQLGDVVNDPRNLAYMHRSINSQKGEMDVYDWLQERSKPHPIDDGKLIVTIESTNVEHVIDKSAVDELYAESKQAVRDGQIQAVKEISTTLLLTGATMAAQQVVGLIIVETIDVFMDELKRVKLISSDGMIEELKASKSRISEALATRFEERQIWSRAKELGLEAGVSGALSVIPQILISLIVKMPAFVYAIIRENTLSVVRCIRVLASNDQDKFASLKIIMYGSASAIAGVYIQHVISKGIAEVPLLNKFNSQVSGILSRMMIIAIPLAAIYTFEQQ